MSILAANFGLPYLEVVALIPVEVEGIPTLRAPIRERLLSASGQSNQNQNCRYS